MNTSRTALKMSWLIALFLIIIPFHAFFTTWAGSNFHHLDLFRIWKEILLIAVLPITAWIVWKSPDLRDWLKRSWIARLFGLYALLHLILGAWALNNGQVNASALIYSLIVNLRFVAFFLMCAVISAKSEFLERNWRNIVLWPALVVVLFGLFQHIVLPDDWLRHFGYGKDSIPAFETVNSDSAYVRVQSTLRGANPLGAYLVLIIPALIFIARKNRQLLAGSLAASFIVLFFTYSRSAYVGVALALLSLFLLSGKLRFKTNWLAVGLLGGIIILAGTMQLLRHNQIAQNTILHTSDNSTIIISSNDARIDHLKSGLRDIEHQPFGRGPGTAGPASTRNTGHESRIAENYFLQIGQEVGAIGMALIIGMMALVGYELYQRRDDELARILLASLVGLTFVNLLSHAWTDDTLAYLWWGLAGIACVPGLVKVKRK
jgi:hypothetical protein